MIFAELDQNKDGKLTQAEFERLFEMRASDTPADGDGVISKAEFIAKYPLRVA